MKAFLCALLLSGVCLAADEAPRHVRVSIQYIEVAHPALTGWLGEGETGAAIHAKAMALVKSGEAKILKTSLVVSRSGQKATVESRLEEIYPWEYEPRKWGGLPNRGIAGFETKSTVITLEIDPVIKTKNPVVELRIMPEFTQRLRLENWMEHKDQGGDSSHRSPIYEKWIANTSLSLQSRKSELVSVITPEAQPPAPAVSCRVLLFVRADVIETRLEP